MNRSDKSDGRRGEAMKIVQVLPGAGNSFYCENCVRDSVTVRALGAAGMDVSVAPLYLPLAIEGIADGPVFYGGINAYLQQKSAFFRKTPRWFDRILDSRLFLRMAARRAGSVRASGLGDMTLSVLRGAEGNQAKELERLVRWMERIEQVDIVHLSTPLLLGIGAAVKKRLGTPIVCSLQDEDVWIDAMDEPYRGLCWEAMAEGARHVEAFVAVSRYYAEVMRQRMGIDPDRMHVVRVGVEAEGTVPVRSPAAPPAVGFLARLSESMGLGLLVDAYLKLKRTERFRGLRLHLSGGQTVDDKPFLERLARRFASERVEGDVKIFEDFDVDGRKEFLATLSVLSVPLPKGAAFGTYILEALAAGVPVVEPRLGSFPELIEATGGGVLYEPNDADSLARALGEVLSDEDRRAELGRRGRESVVKSFSLKEMARNMLDVYRVAVATRVSP